MQGHDRAKLQRSHNARANPKMPCKQRIECSVWVIWFLRFKMWNNHELRYYGSATPHSFSGKMAILESSWSSEPLLKVLWFCLWLHSTLLQSQAFFLLLQPWLGKYHRLKQLYTQIYLQMYWWSPCKEAGVPRWRDQTWSMSMVHCWRRDLITQNFAGIHLAQVHPQHGRYSNILWKTIWYQYS